jgi:hypothetical protein
MEPLLFTEAVMQVENRLTLLFGESCHIEVKLLIDAKLIDEIIEIESVTFRDELKYNKWEIIERARRKGFILLTLHLGKRLVAFFFGYDDPDLSGGYYGDTLASIIEGKGVGSSLFSLVHIYCYENGYSHFTCHTEEYDEKGRHLRDWYIASGMTYLGTHSEEGDQMRVRLTPQHARWMYHRFILGEKLFQRPTSN